VFIAKRDRDDQGAANFLPYHPQNLAPSGRRRAERGSAPLTATRAKSTLVWRLVNRYSPRCKLAHSRDFTGIAASFWAFANRIAHP
jgi:hypothetical protein